MKLRATRCRFSLVLSLMLCINIVLGDSITLTDNQVVYGTITAETPQLVTIDTAKGRFSFPRSKVKQTARSTANENKTKDLRQLLSEGNLDSALLLYESSELSTLLSRHSFNTMMMNELPSIAPNVTATSATVGNLTRSLSSQTSAPLELLLLTANLNLRYGLHANAAQLLRKAESQQTFAPVWPIATIQKLMQSISNAALESQNGELLGQVIRLSAKLPGKQHGEVSTAESYQVIKSYLINKEYLAAAMQFQPELFLRKPETFIAVGEQLLSAIQAEPNSASSLSALETARITIVPYMQPAKQERTLKVLLTNLISSGRTQRAQTIADETAVANPDLGAVLQHLISFKQQYPAAKEEGSVALYKLAGWAKAMGLLAEAKAVFIALRSDPRFVETVNIQIEIIDNAQASATLKSLRAQHKLGQFTQLEKSVQAFLSTQPPDNYAKEAKALLQLANFQKWNNTQSDAGKAEAEYQNAERMAQRGDYDAATDQLNKIQVDRHDSQAALKAQALRQRIIRAKQRALLTSSASTSAR